MKGTPSSFFKSLCLLLNKSQITALIILAYSKQGKDKTSLASNLAIFVIGVGFWGGGKVFGFLFGLVVGFLVFYFWYGFGFFVLFFFVLVVFFVLIVAL